MGRLRERRRIVVLEAVYGARGSVGFRAPYPERITSVEWQKGGRRGER